MAKTTAWHKIKADYLNGVTPKELAEKYKLPVEKIYYKIDNDSWAKEKTKINENVRSNVQERIDRLTNLALERLECVLREDEIKMNDLISAIGKALEVSGLKSQKHEIENKGINIIVADEKHKKMLEEL